MEKYISAEAAAEAFRQLIIASGKPQGIYHERTYLDGIAESRNAIRSITPADVVEVVRCKECKFRGTVACLATVPATMKDNEYCSDGKRRLGNG